MWAVVSFDLPVGDSAGMRRSRMFWNALKRSGFVALQKSVYVRWCESSDRVKTLERRIVSAAPDSGQILWITIPDERWKRMILITEGGLKDPPCPPDPWFLL